jgi:hypothetical protein
MNSPDLSILLLNRTVKGAVVLTLEPFQALASLIKEVSS